MQLKEVIDSYMRRVPEVKWYCERCLKTDRWYENVLLMIVDAAFTSIGLNYFQTVVPKVEKFRIEFVNSGRVRSLEDLAAINIEDESLKQVWRNRRSWQVVKSIASYLAWLKQGRKLNDREAFIYWARNSKLENWREDPIGKIKGVGINTFQYLRMMGGVDTVMPDKVVRRVLGEVLSQANIEIPPDDLGFIRLIEKVARETDYKAIELCWMTWLIQSEAGLSRIKKYAQLLPRI